MLRLFAGSLCFMFAAAAPAVADDRPAIVESGPLRFEASVIRGHFGYAYGTVAADLDRDGDLDLTAADATDNQLMWFANDGEGNFRQNLVYDNDPGLFERHAVGDINGDGWLDIVVVKNWLGELLWFEHSGKAGDVNPWKRHVLTTDLPRAYDVAIADIDGDGRVDLLGTSLLQPLVAWYEASRDDGTGEWIKHIVDDQSDSPCHGHPADIDGDGDIDIIVALGYAHPESPRGTDIVAWYENVGEPGDGSKWTKHKIGDLVWAFEAIAVDLDGDGDMDAVGTSMGSPGGIHWFENTGDPRGQWKKHAIMPTWVNANQVIAADINNDGRMDLIGTAERGSNDLRLWKNVR